MKYLQLSLVGGFVFVVAGMLIVGCSSDGGDKITHENHDHDHAAMANVQDANSNDVDAKPYPIKVCIVSGEELGSMGEPKVLVYEGREMKFCCKDCVKEFNAEPEKYLEELSKATTDNGSMKKEIKKSHDHH